jgi:predicted Zn-dependent protease
MKRILILLFISLIALGNTNAQKIDLDKKLGKENAQKVVDQFGIYQDAAMTAYVDAVGQRLVSHLDSVYLIMSFILFRARLPMHLHCLVVMYI